MTHSRYAPNTLGTAVSWAETAACRGYDLAEFFTESKLGMKRAKQICAGCPVRRQCLEEALRAEVGSRYGIYGGLTAAERTRLVKDRGDETTEPAPVPLRAGRGPAACGTRSGYTRHRKRGENCDACRQANTDANNRLVRTGTTKVTA